mgnify:CR=1 FL=1
MKLKRTKNNDDTSPFASIVAYLGGGVTKMEERPL